MGPHRTRAQVAAEAAAAKRRRLGRRDTDEQAREVIKRQLGSNVSQTALTQHIVDGLSLLERVKADKRKAKLENRNLGPVYWRQLRETYAIADTIGDLQVLDANQAIDEQLMKALEQCRNPNSAKRSLTMLQSWFGSVRDINQRCMVAVVKVCWALKAHNRNVQALLMACMKCSTRLQLAEKYPQDTLLI